MDKKSFTFAERTIAQQIFAKYKRTHRVVRIFDHFKFSDESLVAFGFVGSTSSVRPQVDITTVKETDFDFIYWN